MNDHNQKMEPTRFDLGSEHRDTESERQESVADNDANGSASMLARVSRTESQRSVLIGLGGLLLVAAMVFFWLPTLVSEPQIELAIPEQSASRLPQGPKVSPWSDAQLQRQRKAAQNVLALLLEEQFALEELGVQEWADEEFSDAVGLATKGDELYRQQEFLSSMEHYQMGLDGLLAISAKVPQIFEHHLQRGLQALETGDPDAAITHLKLAQLINPISGEVDHALGRAVNLAPVMELLRQAHQAHAANDLDLAVNLLTEASALDPEHSQVQAELQQTRRDVARRDFNRAMTAGYDALDRREYDEAEQQFMGARRIMPSSGETESAIAEARNGRTRTQMDRLADKAAAAETSENWDQAVVDYQAILNIDETVVFARSGMIRSKTRADLDKRLQKIIDEPHRLQDQGVYNRAQQSWREAASLSSAGPRLKRQLEQVREQLALATMPIAVLLQSDELTEVTVYRVAKLGSFRRHQLELKPGTYTAVGVRSGYRDVRRKFTVAHGKTNPVIDISCTEPI